MWRSHQIPQSARGHCPTPRDSLLACMEIIVSDPGKMLKEGPWQKLPVAHSLIIYPFFLRDRNLGNRFLHHGQHVPIRASPHGVPSITSTGTSTPRWQGKLLSVFSRKTLLWKPAQLCRHSVPFLPFSVLWHEVRGLGRCHLCPHDKGTGEQEVQV